MFAQERRDVILQVLHQDGTVLVKDLSERFAVTEDCIRKDLAFLENQGFLKRTYGGAMELRSNPHKFHVSDRKSEDIEGKQMIAKKAFAHLSRGDTVYLDISTSNLELMKEIVRNSLEVKVVTNMVDLFPWPPRVGFSCSLPEGSSTEPATVSGVRARSGSLKASALTRASSGPWVWTWTPEGRSLTIWRTAA